MSLLCMIQGHEPSADQVWNRGFSFSRCRRCRRDMIRSDAGWDLVPRGHRVVWKAGRHEHSRRPGYVRNLPILYRDIRGGLPAPWFGGWYRHILLLAGGGTAGRLAAPDAVVKDDPERDPRQYPYLLAFVAIAGAGLQLLLSGRGRGGL